MTPAAQLIVGNKVVDLSEGEPAIVPAGDVVIAIDGADDSTIRLDGRLRMAQQAGHMRLIALDLTRSTGFHHLHIEPGHHFWFGTTDAKLGLEGVVTMLGFLAGAGLGWTGQLIFSDGGELRDLHVTYGWLDANADDILDVAEEVSLAPHRSSHPVRTITDRGGGKIAVSATMRLLRRRKELLERVPGGVFSVGRDSYSPRKVMAWTREPTLDTPANRRLRWLVTQLRRLAGEVKQGPGNEAEADRCDSWIQRCDRFLLLSPLASLPAAAGTNPPSNIRTVEELVDPRYAAAFMFAATLPASPGWIPQEHQSPLYSFVGRSDEIYQTFVAAVIAASLGATDQSLTATSALLEALEWNVYVNKVPPPSVLRGWRSFTNLPDAYRPDLLFVQKTTAEVAIADAKYRNDGVRASESARKEVLAYMAAFGIDRAVIFFPPDPPTSTTVHRLAHAGRLLVEYPIAPTDGLGDRLSDELPLLLAELAVAPQWRDA